MKNSCRNVLVPAALGLPLEPEPKVLWLGSAELATIITINSLDFSKATYAVKYQLMHWSCDSNRQETIKCLKAPHYCGQFNAIDRDLKLSVSSEFSITWNRFADVSAGIVEAYYFVDYKSILSKTSFGLLTQKRCVLLQQWFLPLLSAHVHQ